MTPRLSSPYAYRADDFFGPAPSWPGVPSPFNYPVPPKPKSYWWTLLIAVPVGLYFLFGLLVWVYVVLFAMNSGFN